MLSLWMKVRKNPASRPYMTVVVVTLGQGCWVRMGGERETQDEKGRRPS